MNSVNLSSLLLDMSPNFIYISDIDTHEIYYINSALLNLLGNPPEEVWKSTPCHKILQGLDEPCGFCNNALLKEDEFHEWRHFDSLHNTWLAIKNRKIQADGKNLRLGYALEATELFEKEKNLHDSLQEEQALVACISLLHSSNDLQSSLQKITDQLLNFYKADRAYIIDFDLKKNVANNSLESFANNMLPHSEKFKDVDLRYLNMFFDFFEKESFCHIRDLEKDVDAKKYPRTYGLLKEHNVSSLLLVPLIVEKQIVGLFGVDNPKNHTEARSLLKQISYFISDFKERERLFEKLHELSYSDSLTPLNNMHKYVEDLARYEKYPPSTLGVAYVDINGLKKVNDTIGHEAGNKLIISLGNILHDIFTCFAYRTGGDEFIILYPECSEVDFKSKLDILREKIREDKDLFVAIGSSWSDNPQDTIKSQIQISDAAMYNDKREFYSSSNFDRRQRR